jgi:hypothetical protein
MTPPGPDRRLLLLGVLALLTFTGGYLGQGSWRVGARAQAPVISAIATDVTGGAGSRQPIRVQVTIAVANDGTDQIQVLDPGTTAPGVTVVGLDPRVLTVPAGRVRQVNADIALNCDRPDPLALPALRVELIDGVQRRLEVGGSGVLLEACSRAVAAVRPLAASIGRAQASGPSDPRLAIMLTSPTGRAVDVSAVRAGGVSLSAEPRTVSVAGTGPATVRLSAPRSCPEQWRVNGIPGALAFDLAPAPPSGSVTTVQLSLGTPLTSWLLATSCAGTG